MDKITTEIETTYAPDTDITFIMEATYNGGELVKYECVGWYSGEPNEEDTAFYSKERRLAAIYE